MKKLKKFKKYTGAIIRQYYTELVIFMIMLYFLCTLIALYKGNIILCLIIFIADILIGMVMYLFVVRITLFLVKKLAKKNGKILQLTRRNEICMIPQDIKDEGQFLTDFDTILSYCQEKGIKRIFARTHRVLVAHILYNYRVSRYNIAEYLSMLPVGRVDVIDTKFGKIEITYKGKGINGCNRYNKKIKKWRERVFKETDGYKLVMYLDESVTEKLKPNADER